MEAEEFISFGENKVQYTYTNRAQCLQWKINPPSINFALSTLQDFETKSESQIEVKENN